jgi:hypothetical protein
VASNLLALGIIFNPIIVELRLKKQKPETKHRIMREAQIFDILIYNSEMKDPQYEGVLYHDM